MDSDIFTDQKKVVDNIRESAKSLGVNPDQVAPEMEEKQVLVAKKNCKFCYGLGALTVAGQDTYKKAKSIAETLTSAPENRVGRDSRKPEPKEKVKAVVYCKCVKPVTIRVPKVPA